MKTSKRMKSVCGRCRGGSKKKKSARRTAARRTVSQRSARSKSRSDVNYKVQSIVVPMSIMSEKEAVRWIKKHYGEHGVHKIDVTPNTYRFRQIDPDTIRKQGYIHYKNKVLPNGVELVLAYKHPKK